MDRPQPTAARMTTGRRWRQAEGLSWGGTRRGERTWRAAAAAEVAWALRGVGWMQWRQSWVAVGLVTMVALVVAVGCTTRQGAQPDQPLPVSTASPVPQPQQANTDLQTITVTITNNQFDHDVYQAHPGDTRLVMRAHGGPYLFSIDRLVDQRELPADTETVVLVSITDPGQYTMHL